MAGAYLVVAWIFVGGRFWLFPVAGLLTGVLGAWFRLNPNAYGAVAAATALGALAYARGFPLPPVTTVIVVLLCGLFGLIAGIDDRLGGS